MSELIKSGIVLYPVGNELAHMSLSETGPGGEAAFQAAMNMLKPDVRPNLARQLGAATNSRNTEDGSIELGTAIAVPYSSSLAFDLDTLRHDPASGLLRVAGWAQSIEAGERKILGELASGIHRELQEQDLARDGLFAALSGRRIDMILPTSLERRAGVIEAASNLVSQRVKYASDEVISASVWQEHPDGVFLELSRNVRDPDTPELATLQQSHPLHAGEYMFHSHAPHTHIVKTTRATGTGTITESVVTPTEHQERVNTVGNGISWRRSEAVAVTNTIEYPLPHDQPHTAEELTENHIGQELGTGSLTNIEGLEIFEPRSYDQVYADSRQRIAGAFDPATSPEWNARIR